MAAAASPSLVSQLFSQPAHWIEHAPDWATLQAIFAAGSGQDTNQIHTHITNLSHRSPVAISFTIQGDTNHIYVCHSPTIFSGNPLTLLRSTTIVPCSWVTTSTTLPPWCFLTTASPVPLSVPIPRLIWWEPQDTTPLLPCSVLVPMVLALPTPMKSKSILCS
jgi:hypothetical protein